jgi:cbb3-type cytochrome oxidase subunit 1
VFSTPRLFIKTGIAFLGVGLVLGSWLLVGRELRILPTHPLLTSAHVHAVGIGFVMFIILGVAQWLFPRPPKEDTRYRPHRLLVAYWILTIATGLRIVTETARVWSDALPLRLLVVASGVGQVIGLAWYFYSMWSRIRPVGSALREKAGERF